MEFTLEKFFFDTPIYSRVEIKDMDNKDFKALFNGTYLRDFEGYNPWKKSQSTFFVSKNFYYYNTQLKTEGGFGQLQIQCKRYHDEFVFYVYWDPEDKFFYKIGQWPTIADFHLGELKQY